MTAAEAPGPRPVVARAIDDEHERPYVWTTVASSLCTLYGGAGGLYADRKTIARLADAILRFSAIHVVTFDRDPTILGFVAFSSHMAREVEFIYLRQSVVPRRAWDEAEWGVGKPHVIDRAMIMAKLSPRSQEAFEEAGYSLCSSPFTDDELRVSDRVVTALLGDARTFTARRALHPRVLEAVVHAGYSPMVVPRSI